MYIKDGICYAGELVPGIEVIHGFVSWLEGEIDIAPATLYAESYKYVEENISWKQFTLGVCVHDCCSFCCLP